MRAPGCQMPSGQARDGADSLLGSVLWVGKQASFSRAPVCQGPGQGTPDPHGSRGRWPQRSHLPKFTDGKRWANSTKASSPGPGPQDSTEHSHEDETWGPELWLRAGGKRPWAERGCCLRLAGLASPRCHVARGSQGRQGWLVPALAFSSVKWPQHPTQRTGRRPGAGCPGTTPQKPSAGWVCASPAHAHRLVSSSGHRATVPSSYHLRRELEA